MSKVLFWCIGQIKQMSRRRNWEARSTWVTTISCFKIQPIISQFWSITQTMYPSVMQLLTAFICSGLKEIIAECMICIKQSKASLLVLMPLILNSDGKQQTQRLVWTLKYGHRKHIKYHQRVNATPREEFTDKALKRVSTVCATCIM